VAAYDSAVQCDHSVGCITCGDEAAQARVLSLDAGSGLARCSVEPGGEVEEVDIALVEPVRAGDRLLVHARVALQRLTPEEVRDEAPAEGVA
jgi:hydrogenase maturation factor